MRHTFALLAFLLAFGGLPAIGGVPAGGVPAPEPPLPGAFVPPPILMYHRVDRDVPRDPVGRDLTVTPEQFADQLASLKAQGIAAISMADLERRLRTGQSLDHTVVLTFDDGYADQYADALPVLRQYGARATFYIVTGMVGRRRHVTWSDLRAMLADGMDIAAHGVQHNDLAHMTGPQQAFQIDDSVLTLEQRLRTRIASYAYPSGRFDGETLMLMQRANVPLAVTTDARYVIPPENRFEMTRVRVLGEWGLPQFSRAIEAALVHASIVRS